MNHTSLTKGPIFKTLFMYSFPLIITNVVQLLFHAADVAVLSLMAGDHPVAAVGACGSLITLLVSLFTGFATGANVLVARKIGAGDKTGVRQAVGTSLVIGFLSGVILMVLSLIFARQFLIFMNCQPDVLDMAALYMKIYFLGMPFTMLYNFVATILHASGDSIRPMTYMLISGIINIVLNIFFVGVTGLTVEGVAIATVLSNLVALILGLITLARSNGICKIVFKELYVHINDFKEMVKIAIPTCLCSLCFYVANVVISSAINSMSTEAMTANAIAGQFDGIIYNVGCSIAIGTSAIVGQNFGAGKLDRIRKTMRMSILYVTVVSIFLGIIFVILAEPLLRIMTKSPEVIRIAKDRMTLLCLTYFITSIMEVFSFSLRALCRQISTMIVGGICGLGMRCLWVWYVWPYNKTLSMLFSCYAISALLAIIIYLFVYRDAMKKFETKFSKKSSILTKNVI